jgi:hypothetical protein
MVYSPSGSGDVHVDQVLTQISIGYSNNGLVGENLFPAVPVKKQSDKFYVFGREGWLPEDDVRAPGAVAREILGAQVSTQTYYAVEHALQIPVTDEERKNADSPLSPDRDGTEIVTSKIMLGRERAIQTYAHTAANYATGHSVTLSGTSQFTDYTNSDPIGVFRTGKRAIHSKIFREPNTLVIPYAVMSVLEDHPDFLERIKYSERAIFSPELLGAILGFGKIVVPGVGINTAPLGQAESLAYLWGNDIVMAYVPERPGMKIPAYGYEFVWEGQVVDRWRENPRKSDIIRVSRAYDHKMTALDSSGKQIAGYLILDAIA